MRILITGGQGTVGAGLARELAVRGKQVVTCDAAHSPAEVGFSVRTDVPKPAHARCDVGDFRQIERVVEQLGPFELVYHCAAEFGRWNGEDFYEQLWRTNAVGTKHLIRLQEKHRFRLVHFSSSEVYGDWDDVMSEDVMEKNEIRQMNDYALSKWVNECQIRNSTAQYETESVIVRLFNTYGPGEYYSPYRSVNCRFIYCGLMGLPWVVFRGHSRTSTFSDDCVRTLANISERFKPGEVYNISSDQHHTIEELSDLVIELTGADPGLVETRDSEILTTLHKRVDNSKARRDLDHRDSVSLREGIRKTAEWMRSVYQSAHEDPGFQAELKRRNLVD